MNASGSAPQREPDGRHPGARREAETHPAALTEATLRERMRQDVLRGLAQTPKAIPSKYLYDEAGASLFERICELPEYYLTRTETAILRERLGEIAALVGPDCLVIEFGGGSGLKTDLLLSGLDHPTGYVGIEINESALRVAAAKLRERHPALEIVPLRADYTDPIALPPLRRPSRRRLAFFPGSTIGNLEDEEARLFLARVRRLVGEGGGMLLGVDLPKDAATLGMAYDDPRGITAHFNLNLLRRLNRELDGDIPVDHFRHKVVWNERLGRIEMHLESLVDHVFRVAGKAFTIARGETIHTENSTKYTRAQFAHLAEAGGWRVEKVWTDCHDLFSVQLLAAV